MKKLKQRNIVLLLVGHGPAQRAIEDIIEENDLHGQVIIHDAVNYTEIPKYIAMSDAGLIPLPNIPDWVHQNALNLLECLAMCKPVIVTDIPANRSVVGDAKFAIYVSSRGSIDFSKAMAYFCDNRVMFRKHGPSGRTLVSLHYTWNMAAKRLDSYLRTLQSRADSTHSSR
jgi:glycosyltransferase involved in cell wall biosynthesis